MWLDTTAQRHIPAHSRLIDTVTGSRPAVFLDRDGVIVEDVDFLTDPAQIRVLPGVVEALKQLQSFFHIIIVTNQSGIARGYLTEEDLLRIHGEILQQLKGCFIDVLYYCPHLPGASLAAYDRVCECRKPRPGMLLRATREWRVDLARSFTIGDRLRDVEAGLEAGTTNILLGNHAAQTTYSYAADLHEAVPLILAKQPHRSANVHQVD
jgi:D-glycero-D-manno-heptose 1,7-bisphosphate phosphatase